MSVFCDWKVNKGNIKARLILLGFRISHLATKGPLWFVLLIPQLIVYRLLVEWVLGCEIPYKTKIGVNLALHHGQSLVVNDKTVIGENCTLRHSTTIGNKKLKDGTYSNGPQIGNNVDVGANVCILGAISIGSNVSIGVGTIIVKDVPSNCVVVGNPARILMEKEL